MKTRLIALIMTVFMVISVFAVGASAAAPNYASAANGDVLYEVNFNGDDVYKPFHFRRGTNKVTKKDNTTFQEDLATGTTVDVQDGGKTLVVTYPAKRALADDESKIDGSAWFYGGPIKGLTLGEGKQYTITLKMSFPSGNAGFYFNFGYAKESDNPLNNFDYNGLYGLYGKLKGKSLTLSRAAGAKQKGEKLSDGSNYNTSPVTVENGTIADVKVEIDGYFYSIWLKAESDTEWTLYDQLNMLDKSRCPTYAPCENLGFSVYLYNFGAKTEIKDVVIKKGCSYLKSNSTYTAPAALAASKIDYNAAKSGDKLADLLFNAKTGAYVPVRVAENSTAVTTISEDGKTYTVQLGDKAAGEWFGSTIGQLKITDNTKYTFKYKLKAANTADTSTYIVGIAYNSDPSGLGTRLNWYGCFSDTVKKLINVDGTPTAANAVKYAFVGTNFYSYGYTDDNQKIFTSFEPKVDSDGFIDVAVELDGWKWTIYEADASGNYVKLQTVDNKELSKNQLGNSKILDDNLAFLIYTYNKNVSDSVKDVELYKGTVVSVDYTTTTE
ncbi:MAG: hypothetical protein II634_06425, partial [Lachnospiraceae bacterium]|nr:hypothetical protein [Lachnospiraceae bacterium]